MADRKMLRTLRETKTSIPILKGTPACYYIQELLLVLEEGAND